MTRRCGLLGITCAVVLITATAAHAQQDFGRGDGHSGANYGQKQALYKNLGGTRNK